MMKLDILDILCLNPSVDIYKIGDDIIEFYYISTRNRISIKVSPSVIKLLSIINGMKTIKELFDEIQSDYKNEKVYQFITFLLQKKIVFIKGKVDNEGLSKAQVERYDRQLTYFESMYENTGYKVQKNIENTTIAIFGVGAIGSGIALQLSMAGIKNFKFIDKGLVRECDIQRHFTFNKEQVGMSKVEALKDTLKSIDSEVECQIFNQSINYDTEIDVILEGVDFVVNTLDEPYIGYTSMKIGRECFSKRLPMFVAGGFDAHLMSTGELIVPYETPCVDCYVSYFSQSLTDWKPSYNLNAIEEINIKKGNFEVGGLSSMSLFSISYAVISIIDYIATKEALRNKGRGELLIDEMKITYLNIPKNPNCKTCGKK